MLQYITFSLVSATILQPRLSTQPLLTTTTTNFRFGQLSKYTSAMYKCLTPEEKELWDHRAAEDKARFDAEMLTYIPPPGHDPQGILIEELRPKEKKPRKVKDPNAPKRARGMCMNATCVALLALCILTFSISSLDVLFS